MLITKIHLGIRRIQGSHLFFPMDQGRLYRKGGSLGVAHRETHEGEIERSWKSGLYDEDWLRFITYKD